MAAFWEFDDRFTAGFFCLKFFRRLLRWMSLSFWGLRLRRVISTIGDISWEVWSNYGQLTWVRMSLGLGFCLRLVTASDDCLARGSFPENMVLPCGECQLGEQRCG